MGTRTDDHPHPRRGPPVSPSTPGPYKDSSSLPTPAPRTRGQTHHHGWVYPSVILAVRHPSIPSTLRKAPVPGPVPVHSHPRYLLSRNLFSTWILGLLWLSSGLLGLDGPTHLGPFASSPGGTLVSHRLLPSPGPWSPPQDPSLTPSAASSPPCLQRPSGSDLTLRVLPNPRDQSRS